MKIVISASVDAHQVEKLKALCIQTGLTRSEVIRLLIDSAEVAPPVPAKARTTRVPRSPLRQQTTE